MSGFQLKYSFLDVKKFFLRIYEKENPESALKKSIDKKRSILTLFLFFFKREFFFSCILQVLVLACLLAFPFVTEFYLKFFLNNTSPIAQARLFSVSVYVFAYISLAVIIFNIKNNYLMAWNKKIKYHFIYLLGKFLNSSRKDTNLNMLNRISEPEELIKSCLLIPKVLTLGFSLLALVVCNILFFYLMGRLFLFSFALLVFFFYIQYKLDLSTNKTEERLKEFTNSRSQFLKMIFSFGNRVRFLAMETFFLRKINYSQNSSHEIVKENLNKNALSRLIYHYSGFAIAVPGLILSVQYFEYLSSTFIVSVMILFILTAHFYKESYLFFVTYSKLRIDFKSRAGLFLFDNIEFKQKKELDTKNEIAKFLTRSKNYLSSDEGLYLKNATFMTEQNLLLYNLSLDVKPGNLVAVVGLKNSGKSAFLSACAGELHLLCGERSLPKEFEFLSENSFFIEGTIKDNIILAHDYDSKRYAEVLRMCALQEELNSLQEGDASWMSDELLLTKSTLKRIAIARCIYPRTHFYLFDNLFDGLSSQESSYIFNEVILKYIDYATRIVVTDKLEFAALCHHILVFKDGIIAEQGSHKSLVERSGLYARMFYSSADMRSYDFVPASVPKNTGHKVIVQSSFSAEDKIDVKSFSPKSNIHSSFESIVYFLRYYFRCPKVFQSFVFILLTQVLFSFSFYFLFSQNSKEIFNTKIQVLLFSGIMFLAFFSFFLFYKKILQINSNLSLNLEKNINDFLLKDYEQNLIQSISYIEDFTKVKNVLFQSFSSLVIRIALFVSACLLLALANISAILLFLSLVIFAVTYLFIIKNKFFNNYSNLSDEKQDFKNFVKQFFSLYKKPQSASLRNYQLHELYLKSSKIFHLESKQDSFMRYFFYFITIYFLVIICSSIVYFIVKYDTVFAGNITLVILAGALFFLAFNNFKSLCIEFVTCLPAFEKLMQLSISYQKNEDLHYSISDCWPKKGLLKIIALSTFDNENNLNAIQNLSATFKHGSRIAVVESLQKNGDMSYFFSALMKFIPFQNGGILLDEEDILRVNPIELRSRFGYISLNSLFPFLSIRENIDPFEYFDDSEIWSVLNRVGMSQAVALLRNGLNTKIEELPSQFVWSGEVVLFSFARALLQANKMLLLDHLSLPEDVELRVLDLFEREFYDSTIVVCGDPKSSLMKVCQAKVVLAKSEMDSPVSPFANAPMWTGYENEQSCEFKN